MTTWKDDDSQLELGEDEDAIALRKAWDKTLRTLSVKVSKSSFESFFKATRPLALDHQTVVLGAPSRFAREWLEKRYGDTLRSLLEQHLGRSPLMLRFVLTSPDARPLLGEKPPILEQDRHTDASAGTEQNLFGEMLPASPQPGKAAVGKGKRSPDALVPIVRAALPPELTMPLNEKYTFDNFVVGKSNRLAHAGAQAVAESVGKVYNPLFLYGGPGLGKTHLMHAIGHRIQDTWPEARIAYISGESFTNSYIAALRDRKSESFRQVYRSVNVWLVDDIQTIAGKEHTKEEFFHTFNTLHQSNKQIILSSDRSPRELRMMDERLRSRFECGLIADIAPPELEMRVAILHKKALLEGLRIPDEVLFYMANLIQSNIRSLEGALIKIMATASLSKIPVTKQLASDVLGAYFVERRPMVPQSSDIEGEWNREENSPLRSLPMPPLIARLNAPFGGNGDMVNFERIVEAVAEHFGLDARLLAGEGSVVASRRREVAPARQYAIYLAREKTNLPVTEIAGLFGGLSHSAVSHAHKKMLKALQEDPKTALTLREILSKL